MHLCVVARGSERTAREKMPYGLTREMQLLLLLQLQFGGVALAARKREILRARRAVHVTAEFLVKRPVRTEHAARGCNRRQKPDEACFERLL